MLESLHIYHVSSPTRSPNHFSIYQIKELTWCNSYVKGLMLLWLPISPRVTSATRDSGFHPILSSLTQMGHFGLQMDGAEKEYFCLILSGNELGAALGVIQAFQELLIKENSDGQARRGRRVTGPWSYRTSLSFSTRNSSLTSNGIPVLTVL